MLDNDETSFCHFMDTQIRRCKWPRLQSRLCPKPDGLASRLMSSWLMASKKKAKKESPRGTLASVTKEMAQPRFAESARREEETNHHVAADHIKV